MRSKVFKNTFWLLGLALALNFTIVSCDDDDDDENNNEVHYRNLLLTGGKEVPPNQSPNTGTINAVYNKQTNVITYTITWTGFTVTGMHFHKIEDPTKPGPVALPIPKVPANAANHTSPLTGSLTLSDAQETELLANSWYLNIHSAAYPGGEIRVDMIPN